MKKNFIALLFIITIIVSVFLGRYSCKLENEKSFKAQLNSEISFSIARLEDLVKTDNIVSLETLISHIYAASQVATDAELSSALHDLWNALLFYGDGLSGNETFLTEALKDKNPQVIKGVAYTIRKNSENFNIK